MMAAETTGAAAKTLVACVVPIAAAVTGSAWAAWRPPGAKARSAIQHFAAGLVFAVAATELVPDLKTEHRTAAVIFGFSLGVALMLAIQVSVRRFGGESGSPAATLAVTGIDLVVDGLLIGIGFAGGGAVGPLLAFALTIELLGLGVAVALELLEAGYTRTKVVTTTGALSLLVAVGGLLGSTALAHLGGDALSVVLAFATAALLYLVTEELLSEAHETPDTPALTATFFIGFLLILVLSFST
jgi:ZIP family zinc transporter